MIDAILASFRMHSVPDREEVFSVTLPSLRIRVREILSHSFHDDYPIIKLRHRYFRIIRRIYNSDISHLHQRLLLGQDVFQEIFGDLIVARQVVLAKIQDKI